jgi:predicted nucleotidyltransferase
MKGRLKMQMQAEIMAITEKIKETVDCDKIYLFGSYAYGEPNSDSDLDFYVVIPDDSIRPLDAIRMIYRKLSETRMTLSVDVLAAHTTKFEELSALPTMQRKIAREGALLYERSGFSQQVVM